MVEANTKISNNTQIGIEFVNSESGIMHYEGNIIRPPSEANSILLQVTVGCSRNKCTFCGTYAGERFRIKPDAIIMQDIEFAA